MCSFRCGFCLVLLSALFGAVSASASVIQVAAGDVTVNDTTACSLIDAINAANASTTINTTVGACTPTGTSNGGGVVQGITYTTGNVIVLAAGTYTLTTPYTPPTSGYTNAIQFTAADGYWYGPDGLPPIASPIVIVGDPAGSLIGRSTASSTPPFRLFYIGGGLSLANYNAANVPGSTLPGWGTKDSNGNLKPGSLTLVNLTLENGLAQGGSSNYGGGGLGAGGAIYNQGGLILTGDTLTQNQAVGGEGADSNLNPGAGQGIGGGGIGSDASSSGYGGFAPGVLWPDAGAIPGDFGNAGAENSGGPPGGPGGVGGGGGSGAGGDAGGVGGFGGGGGAGGGPGSNLGGIGGYGGGGGLFGGTGGFGGAAGSTCSSACTPGGGGGAGLGGSVFNEGGTVSILNSTLTANTAQGGAGYIGGNGFGGAVFNLNGTVIVRYSTLAGNNVDGGKPSTGYGAAGAVYNQYLSKPGSPSADAGSTATMTVDSSILSGSSDYGDAASDCENNNGTFTSGYDVVQTEGSCSFTNNDQNGTGKLVALAANGGPTETMALQLGSLAINHGDTGTTLGPVPTVDQRGLSRDTMPDVGAYEYNGAPATVGITPPANVTVTVGNAIPNQDFSLTSSLGSALTVTVASSNATLLPNSGVALSSGCGSDSSHYACTLTLTPAPGETGSSTITITATDYERDSAHEQFTLTVSPIAPVADNLALSAYSGTTFTGTLPAVVTPSSDKLNFVVGSAGHGTVTVTNAATGAFTYTPASGYTGSDSFTFTAEDTVTGITSNTATVTITVNAEPVQYVPPVAGNESLTAYAGQPLGGQLTAVAANGHALAYKAVSQPAHGTLTLTASTGAFTYMPASGFTGSDSFTFNANDGTSDSNTATVTITVNAQPMQYVPPVAGNENLTAYVGQTLSGQLFAVAANGHALTYKAVSQPAHGKLTVTASTGAFTYAPVSGFTGSDLFTFNANDGTSDSNTATVEITVNAVPAASAPPPTPPSSPPKSSGGGGGALGLLGLLLLAGLGFGRRVLGVRRD